MSAGRMLIRHGCVIDTEPQSIVHRNTDVLIEEGRIVAVGPDLPADGAEIIDAKDRIVLPGFVDAHRHVWQAPLRGIATTVDLHGYLDLVGTRISPRFGPPELRTANLAGALECLDAGITTVGDYSHIQYSPQHTEAAVAGLRAAGIRAVFGYGAPQTGTSMSDDQWAAEVRRVREEYFAGDNELVTMALAAVGPSYGPVTSVLRDWTLAADLDLPIVLHVGSGPVADWPIETLRDNGLLRPGTLYVHGNSLPDNELALIAESGGAIAIAPAVEAQMGHGRPMINRTLATGVVTGLGVDVVTSTAGDMFTLMRATLLTSQLSEGPASTPAEMLRLATLGGAQAIGLADRIGSLRPGKQADLILLDTSGLNMLGGTHDPIATVVTAAHPGNVDTVLVAGQVVKRDGRLARTDLDQLVSDLRQTAATVVSSDARR